MTIATDLAASLAAPLLYLAAQLGCTVARYTATVTRTADKQSTRTYTADLAAAALPAFFEAGRENQRSDNGTLLKPFGARTTAHGSLTFVKQPGVALPLISAFDGFKITSGPYTGYTWLAQAEGVPDDVGATMVVQVISAPDGAIP